MSKINLGIIGGGQLGSLLSVAAKKLNIQTKHSEEIFNTINDLKVHKIQQERKLKIIY